VALGINGLVSTVATVSSSWSDPEHDCTPLHRDHIPGLYLSHNFAENRFAVSGLRFGE
jgi:hypothetical protein